MYGHNVSHAKNRTRKIFKPNLHSTKIAVNGAFKRVRLCTKCQRVLKVSATVKTIVDKKDLKLKTENITEVQPQIASV